MTKIFSSDATFYGAVIHAMQVEQTGARPEDEYYLLDSEEQILEVHYALLKASADYHAAYEDFKMQQGALGDVVQKVVIAFNLNPEPGKETSFLVKCAAAQAVLCMTNLRTVLKTRAASKRLYSLYQNKKAA